MSEHYETDRRTCKCGEIFVSIMDLNDHIENETGKDMPDYKVERVFP